MPTGLSQLCESERDQRLLSSIDTGAQAKQGSQSRKLDFELDVVRNKEVQSDPAFAVSVLSRHSHTPLSVVVTSDDLRRELDSALGREQLRAVFSCCLVNARNLPNQSSLQP